MALPIPLMRNARPSRLMSLPAPHELEQLGTPETAKQVRQRVYHNRVSERWVLSHHAPESKFREGRESVWFPAHSDEWYVKTYIPQQQQRARARRTKA